MDLIIPLVEYNLKDVSLFPRRLWICCEAWIIWPWLVALISWYVKIILQNILSFEPVSYSGAGLMWPGEWQKAGENLRNAKEQNTHSSCGFLRMEIYPCTFCHRLLSFLVIIVIDRCMTAIIDWFQTCFYLFLCFVALLKMLYFEDNEVMVNWYALETNVWPTHLHLWPVIRIKQGKVYETPQIFTIPSSCTNFPLCYCDVTDQTVNINVNKRWIWV